MIIQTQKAERLFYIIPRTFSTRRFQESARICKMGSTFVLVGPTGGLCQGVTLILRKLDVSAVSPCFVFAYAPSRRARNVGELVGTR